jgi:uncharacterized membrane protein
MDGSFLQLPIFSDIILPFLLVFALVFAVLEKIKLLGDNKHQVNAIIGFVFGAILISFAHAVSIIREFIVFTILSLIILFSFMLIHGFASSGKKSEEGILEDWMKKMIAGVFLVAIVIAVLVLTGYWKKTLDFFSKEVGLNIIFGLVIVGAVFALFKGAGGGGAGGGSNK